MSYVFEWSRYWLEYFFAAIEYYFGHEWVPVAAWLLVGPIYLFAYYVLSRKMFRAIGRFFCNIIFTRRGEALLNGSEFTDQTNTRLNRSLALFLSLVFGAEGLRSFRLVYPEQYWYLVVGEILILLFAILLLYKKIINILASN